MCIEIYITITNNKCIYIYIYIGPRNSLEMRCASRYMVANTMDLSKVQSNNIKKDDTRKEKQAPDTMYYHRLRSQFHPRDSGSSI